MIHKTVKKTDMKFIAGMKIALAYNPNLFFLLLHVFFFLLQNVLKEKYILLCRQFSFRYSSFKRLEMKLKHFSLELTHSYRYEILCQEEFGFGFKNPTTKDYIKYIVR